MGGESVDVQGVSYPADVPGFLAGGSAKGSAEMYVPLTNISIHQRLFFFQLSHSDEMQR